MDKKTRSVTISALLTALTVAFLCIAAVMPTGQLGIVSAASLFTAAAVIESGPVSAAFVFAASCALGAIISPNKPLILLYALFPGYYPIVKCFAERLKRKIAVWLIKLAAFNAALAVAWLTLGDLLFVSARIELKAAIVFPAGSAVFILFDIGLTKLIGLYIARVAGRR
ncbi:MAG: hypothetical protein LBD92_05385 [Oscillospiraceae bacterium]|nr:hypothetical protein [Oscillospiraceae bacterium]